MKQVLENLRTGECYVEDVPAPILRPGSVLVRNLYSVISAGTEGGTVKLGRMSLIGKARARPEQAMKVVQVALTQGVATAYNATMRSLEMPLPLGYCSAGEVIAVAPDVSGIAPGERVACAGPGYANHAEIVCVPKHLCARLPEGLDVRDGAFAALGAIALQSVRIADVRIGERVVVIGLGLIGLITTQILRAAGVHVFGLDLDPERVRVLREEFAFPAALVTDTNVREQVAGHTGGHGVDAVIITAASPDNAPVALAGELARRKGRVVVVGRTEMTAPRETYLFKELELHTSMAYGPGTGDPLYEVEGVDYPFDYVRWTENRNMSAFLDLLARRAVDVESLVTHAFDVDQAGRAFELIGGTVKERSTAIVLRYPVASAGVPVAAVPAPAARPTQVVRARSHAGVLRVGVIGAGSFATNELLPLLARGQDIALTGIVSATGVRARALQRKYGFAWCDAAAARVVEDPDIDAVFVLTRHDTHAAIAAQCLRAGKHVFVEKPLGLTQQELDEVEHAAQDSGAGLMVGFNRRYAPLALRLRDFIGTRGEPASICYRANVGYRPPTHWLHDPRQGGGVILGEACHHIDFCNWLVGSSPIEVTARTLGSAGALIAEDNAHITLRYADGSLSTVLYLSNGAKGCDTERVEVMSDNRVATLVDWHHLKMVRGLSVRRARRWLLRDKGHRAQVGAFLAAARAGRGDELDTRGYLSSSRSVVEAAERVRLAAVSGAATTHSGQSGS